MAPSPIYISGEEALERFRLSLTGERAFEMLARSQGRLLVELPVGVGKSSWLRAIVRYALSQATCDLVLILAPLTQILQELSKALNDIDHLVLESRPAELCGALNPQWTQLEAQGCGQLARTQLCGRCQHRSRCFWPTQYAADSLSRYSVILATQAHLIHNPGFVQQVRRTAGATSMLVLVDEASHLITPRAELITQEQLDRYQEVLVAVSNESPVIEQQLRQGLSVSQQLRVAPSNDLSGANWKVPLLTPPIAEQVQQAGTQRFGDAFRFLGYLLQQFGTSDQNSRRRLHNGTICFSPKLDLGDRFIVFTNQIQPSLARYRLDPNHDHPRMSSPFRHYVFVHPETRWYNLQSLLGAQKNFYRNAPQIFDFFGQKILCARRQGRKILLVTRQSLESFCAEGLNEWLAQEGHPDLRIVTGDLDHSTIVENPNNIPLIHYGIRGVNQFEDFDCVYCLSGYYIPVEAIRQSLVDLDPCVGDWPLEIQCYGDPPRRQLYIRPPVSDSSIIPQVAQGLFEQLEPEVILQAVGRVRPFTKPREIITFYAGRLPRVEYTATFRNLEEARPYFGLQMRRIRATLKRCREAQELRQHGLTQKQIADRLGVSTRTVRKYLKRN